MKQFRAESLSAQRGWFAIAVTAFILTQVAIAQAASIEWVCSTKSNPWQEMPSIPLSEKTNPPQVFVKPERAGQAINGFGGCFNELGQVALSKATEEDAQQVISALFGDEGCAFTLGRIPIGASDFALGYYSLCDTAEDYELKTFSIERDRKHLLPFIKAAMDVRPELKCWGSPWTPPEWMKTNNFYSKGSLRWEPKVLSTYANYFSKWIKAYRAEGVKLYAVSPQNEPNIDNAYTTCIWTGRQLAEFIGRYLGPALAKQNQPIELWVGFNGDPRFGGEDVNYRLIDVMEDAKASAFIDAIGYQYDSRNQTADAHKLYPDKRLVQTESKCYDGKNTWAQALSLYGQIKQHIDGGASEYFAWNMVLNETGKSSWDWAQNAPVTVDSKSGKVTYNGEFYVYKHFSHYVKPGAKYVLTTGSWGDRIAFQNADGSVVVVMANCSDRAHKASVEIDGVAGADTFRMELPAYSVNTFVLQ